MSLSLIKSSKFSNLIIWQIFLFNGNGFCFMISFQIRFGSFSLYLVFISFEFIYFGFCIEINTKAIHSKYWFWMDKRFFICNMFGFWTSWRYFFLDLLCISKSLRIRVIICENYVFLCVFYVCNSDWIWFVSTYWSFVSIFFVYFFHSNFNVHAKRTAFAMNIDTNIKIWRLMCLIFFVFLFFAIHQVWNTWV